MKTKLKTTPEEIANFEFKLLRDVERIRKLKIVEAMEKAIEEKNFELMQELMPSLIEMLACFKRAETHRKVLLRQANNNFTKLASLVFGDIYEDV